MMDWGLVLTLLIVVGIVVYLIGHFDLKGAIEQLRRELGE